MKRSAPAAELRGSSVQYLQAEASFENVSIWPTLVGVRDPGWKAARGWARDPRPVWRACALRLPSGGLGPRPPSRGKIGLRPPPPHSQTLLPECSRPLFQTQN